MLYNYAMEEKACERLHDLIGKTPAFKDPDDLPFFNGLYFFYEEGETSQHGRDGRIVRIGNHPRSQDRLQDRLWDHYSPNKNFSVFRKFLGGALLRKADPNGPCLRPSPGKGHWEKQDAGPCSKCRSLESEVTQLLNRAFSFRCVEIKDKELRNILEKKIIGSISLCEVCQPSTTWLGQYAYSDKVRDSGLWNSNHVFGDDTMTPRDLDTLAKCVDHTLKLLSKTD